MRFLRALNSGDRGDDVAGLQILLNELGLYKGPVTGYFGNLTRNAVMTFQKNNGLTATGSFDAEMMTIINNS
jgi:peptidoglycan hydrolase-like protein with peptidoglycan-binding domain